MVKTEDRFCRNVVTRLRGEDRDPLTLDRFEEILSEVFRQVGSGPRVDGRTVSPCPEDGEGGISRPCTGSDRLQGN